MFALLVLREHLKAWHWYGWNLSLVQLPAVDGGLSQSEWKLLEQSRCLQQSEANLQTGAALKWGCPLLYLPGLLLVNWRGTPEHRVISCLIQSDGCQLAAHSYSPTVRGMHLWDICNRNTFSSAKNSTLCQPTQQTPLPNYSKMSQTFWQNLFSYGNKTCQALFCSVQLKIWY